MDQEKLRKTAARMVFARANLIKENPFFGNLAMNLKLACSPCGTACTDGQRMFFDPDFAEKLSDREMEFVVLHEVYHCALFHCARGRNLRPFLYNIACDIVVNSTILYMWGLNKFTVAGEEPIHQLPDGREGRDFTAEEVYEILIKESKKESSGSGFGFGGDGDFESDDGDCSTAGEDSGAGGGKSGNNNSDAPKGIGDYKPIDDHSVWEEIKDSSKLEAEWAKNIMNSAKSCGDIPAGQLREIIENMKKSTDINWKEVLHDFIQNNSYDYTYAPPDRRFSNEDFFLPNFNQDAMGGETETIWVCIDTSGSISNTELSEFLVEVADAVLQAGLRGKISFFDAAVSEPQEFDTVESLMEITPVGGGGTSFHAIFRYMQENMMDEPPKAVIIFTDGYASVPEEKEALDIPVLWVITKEGKSDFNWGRVVQM